MTTTTNYIVGLTAINCGNCGGTYAINERYRQERYEKGEAWNCPYCQVGWGYANNGENALLKRQLEQKEKEIQRERASHDQTRAALRNRKNQLNAEKAAKSRIKNRISKGVCPCCNRYFADLHRHMTTKHPDYLEGPHE